MCLLKDFIIGRTIWRVGICGGDQLWSQWLSTPFLEQDLNKSLGEQMMIHFYATLNTSRLPEPF